MNDLDRYLDQACRSVSGPVALRQHLRKELKEHLEEAIQELVAAGMSEDEATAKAIEGFGEPEMIREGLQSVYGQSVTSLFVDKAMEWKERTMKTEWRWYFAAQFGLLLIIALMAFLIGSAFVFIVPVVEKAYSDLGMTLPGYLITTINVAYLLHQTAWIWLIALAGALGLYEWKCRSENKALIRLTMSVGASVGLAALAFWVAAAVVIPLVQGRYAMDRRNESVVMARIIGAHESYKQLARAIEDENWAAANESATEVRDAYRFLRGKGAATEVLARNSQLGSFGEIRRLTDEIADFSDELHDAIRDNQEPSIVLGHFTQLESSYSQLMTNSTFFATYLDPESPQEAAKEGTSETGSTTAPQPGDGAR